MNKTLFALLSISMFCIAFSSCKDDEDDGWNPDAPLYITGVDKANKNLVYNIEGELTAHQICTLDSVSLCFSTDTLGFQGARGCTFHCFARQNLDTINNRLIACVGNLEEIVHNQFLDVSAFPYLYVAKAYEIWDEELQCLQIKEDTLGYVPNEQRQAAYEKISEMWESGDKKKMLEIFQNALTFIPCNGEEYRKYIHENNILPSDPFEIFGY